MRLLERGEGRDATWRLRGARGERVMGDVLRGGVVEGGRKLKRKGSWKLELADSSWELQ